LGEIQPVDEPRADPVEVESEPPPEEPSEPELPVGDSIEEALFFDDAVEEPSNDEPIGETPDEVIEPQVEEADVAEETEVDAISPEPVELADVFGCVFCDRALFLNETERTSGDFTCPHCKHENGAAQTRAVAAKQLEAKGGNVETPAPKQKFEELIECPDCEKAIKLMLEQRDDDSVTCPYCKATIAAPEPPAEEEPEDEVVEEVAEPKVGEVAESESVGGEEAAKADTADEPEPAVTAGEAEDEPLFVDEDSGVKESPAEPEEAKADGDDESSGDDTAIPAESPEPEKAKNEVDTSLLESLIESSRNQSLMPEKFSCPKCETEIQLPEAERMMGLCFCTECEELIESKTAYEHITEEPEPVESEKGGESAEVEGGDPTGEAKPEEPDVAAAKEEAAAEMEFWLNDVLPDTVDCARCSNSLKLEDEEKMFGIYRCPYCKEGISHAKGTVVESLGSSGDAEDEEEEEEEVVKKRKVINFKALLPYAAVFVFGVALNYGVIWVSDYLQEQKAHKAEWVIWLKAAQLKMKERPEVYQDALEDGKNKEAFGRLGEMSHDKLKAFRERLIQSRNNSYANWFQDTGDKITNSAYGPVVQGFQRKLNRFIRWVKLAKIDADNLETAFGMNSFERRKAHDLLNTHIVSIREQMDALSTDKAIEQGLVRPEVLSDLMEMSLEVDNFEMKSVKQIVVHLSSMTNKARALEDRYRLSHPSADRLDEYGSGYASHSHSGPGTPWNAEVYQWENFNKQRDRAQWHGIALEYGHLMDSFSDFYRQLETLKRDLDLSRFQHPFLEGGVLALRVVEFQELENAGDLVSDDTRNRLERLAKLLDPYASGSLANDLKTKKTSGTRLTHDEADKLYERFWKEWKRFHLEKQWFELEGVSSYYHISRIGAHSSHNSAE